MPKICRLRKPPSRGAIAPCDDSYSPEARRVASTGCRFRGARAHERLKSYPKLERQSQLWSQHMLMVCYCVCSFTVRGGVEICEQAPEAGSGVPCRKDDDEAALDPPRPLQPKANCPDCRWLAASRRVPCFKSGEKGGLKSCPHAEVLVKGSRQQRNGYSLTLDQGLVDKDRPFSDLCDLPSAMSLKASLDHDIQGNTAGSPHPSLMLASYP